MTCVTGITGIDDARRAAGREQRDRTSSGRRSCNILARTGSSADNAQATHFFMINDDGIFLLRAPRGARERWSC